MDHSVAAVGDVLTGALVGAAVERQVNPGSATAGAHPAHCLNCDTALVGRHWHACGQAAHVHRTIGAFGHDLAYGLFHLEGRMWRTLPMLAWQPGRLTRDYIDGHRARYVSPIALFLFTVFVTFGLFSLTAGPGGIFGKHGPVVIGRVAGRAELQAQIAGLQAQRTQAVLRHRPTAEFDTGIAALAAQKAQLDAMIDGRPGSRGSTIGRRIDSAVRRAMTNPDLVTERLESNAHKYSWLLIPFSVPFVWLLFAFHRRFGLYDHTVFVTYSISFMALLTAIASVTAHWVSGGLGGVMMLYAPVHLYRQLCGAYSLQWGSALWRTAVLGAVAMAVLLGWIVLVTVLVFWA